MNPYLLISNVLEEMETPERGMSSQTLHNDDSIKIILFRFAAGQDLKAHTAPMPATIYFIQGEAVVTLGSDTQDVRAGALIHMQPKLTHGIVAKTPMIMLLYLLKAAREQ